MAVSFSLFTWKSFLKIFFDLYTLNIFKIHSQVHLKLSFSTTMSSSIEELYIAVEYDLSSAGPVENYSRLRQCTHYVHICWHPLHLPSSTHHTILNRATNINKPPLSCCSNCWPFIAIIISIISNGWLATGAFIKVIK